MCKLNAFVGINRSGVDSKTLNRINTLEGYFSSKEGEDGDTSLNRWNMAYYLNEAMIYGGPLKSSGNNFEVTISEALKSKNKIQATTLLMNPVSTNPKDYKNVYFVVSEKITFLNKILHPKDIILSTGVEWITISSGNVTKYNYTNGISDPIIFQFADNYDENYLVTIPSDNNMSSVDVIVEGNYESCKQIFCLFDNKSNVNVTVNFENGETLLVEKNSQVEINAKIYGTKVVYSLVPSLSLISRIKNLEGKL